MRYHAVTLSALSAASRASPVAGRCVAGCLALARARRRAGAAYDLVVANGRVMDPESGLDAVRHVGIRGGTIAAISETPLTGHARHRRRRTTSSRPASSTSTSTASRRSATG